MSVDNNDQWMVAVSTDDLVSAIREDRVNVASFYGHMQGRRMTRGVFEQLLSALHCNTTLRELDIDHNEVGRWEDGVPRLLASLQHMPVLRRINFNSCQIDDAGVQHICDFLASNTTVSDLWLYGNNVTLEGAMMLHKTIISRNSTLRTLDLRNNGLPSPFLKVLIFDPIRSTDRPRPLTLVELLRLQFILQRFRYKPGVFPPLNDDWQDVLLSSEPAATVS